MPPETRYAKSGDLNIAYQVLGDGPVDLVYVPGWISHVELSWELPDLAGGFERLAPFSRLIMFDKRGTGMSDAVPPAKLPTLEQRMALAIFGSTVKRLRRPDYPWAPTPAARKEATEYIERHWTSGLATGPTSRQASMRLRSQRSGATTAAARPPGPQSPCTG